MSENGDKKYVTLSELDRKLDKVPTRWEVRFLIVVAFLGGQVAPSVQWQQPVRSSLAAVIRVVA